MPVEKQRHVHMLPGRRERIEPRVSVFPGLPSWIQVDQIIQEKFKDEPELVDFFVGHSSLFRRFYGARLAIAHGENPTKLNKFMKRFMDAEKKSANPELFAKSTPIMSTIRDSLSRANQTRMRR